jgi:endonuclease/exonuclease/phosphatase (EEP) superfamily protein YafD
VYNPPDISKEDEQKLFSVLKQASTHRHVILTGDFNHPSINWSTFECDNEGEDFLDCVNDCFWFQHVLEPTRGENVLDLVFSSEEEMVQDVEVGETCSSSDHNMVRFSVACSSVASESGSKNQSVNFRKAN